MAWPLRFSATTYTEGVASRVVAPLPRTPIFSPAFTAFTLAVPLVTAFSVPCANPYAVKAVIPPRTTKRVATSRVSVIT